MSTSTEAPFSYTSKVDGNLFTVRGQDFADFTENLGLAYGDAANDILQRASEQAVPLSAGYSAPAQQQAVQNLQQGGVIPPPDVPYGLPAGVPVAQQYGQPQTQYQQPTGAMPAVPTCVHGPRTRREGTYKTGRNAGKAYVGFFCSTAQGDPSQCKPIFS